MQLVLQQHSFRFLILLLAGVWRAHHGGHGGRRFALLLLEASDLSRHFGELLFLLRYYLLLLQVSHIEHFRVYLHARDILKPKIKTL